VVYHYPGRRPVGWTPSRSARPSWLLSPPTVAPCAQRPCTARTVVGAEFNVAAGLARLGHHVQFAGRVGDDPLGQVVEEACRAHGIEGHLGRDAGSFTGVLVRDMQTSRPTIVGYARSGSRAAVWA